MPRLLIVTALTFFVACPAFAGSFESRQAAAAQLENSPAQQLYQAEIKSVLNTAVHDAMTHCYASTGGARPTPFALVADIDASGSLVKVAVQPDGSFAACFAQQIALVTFPAPTDTSLSDGYPINIDMHFH